MSWTVERATGSARAFHARPLPDRPARAVWVHEVDGRALVLGSSQPDSDVDAAACAAQGVAVVRRRSGGGAVLLEPGGALWVDVIVPARDPLWSDDVVRAAFWLGEAWARALASLGLEATVHRGNLCRTRWSRLVCFAALGPGEVSLGDRKVVGISQRRTRDAARFQCVVLTEWTPERLVSLLAVDDRAGLVADLAPVATGVGIELAALEAALLAQLP